MKNIKWLQRSIRIYITPWVNVNLKDRCEVCGSTKDLQLHHIDHFNEILYGEIERLGYNYLELDKKKYNEVKFNVIKIHMDGKVKHKTLCEKCHKELHSTERVKQYFNVEKDKILKIKEYDRLMKPYIGKENINLKQFCNIIKEDKTDIHSLNDKLNKLGMKYTFVNKDNKLILMKNVDLILSNFSGNYLFKDEKEELSNQLKPYLSTTHTRKGTKMFNLNYINAYLERFNHKYTIINKRIMSNGKRPRVWDIVELCIND